MTTEHEYKTLVEQCYKNLKEGIIHGEFLPGEKLQIAKLRTRFNIGPTPIREALSRLISSGLIEDEANKGFRVKKISQIEVKDIYATFTQIEILALSQSIKYGDICWEAGIIASLHQLSSIEVAASPVDPFAWLKKNYEFHLSLISACNSPCLLKIREQLYQLFDRYCHLSVLINKNSLALNNKDHSEIAKAAIDRNSEKACKLTTLHLENSLDLILDSL